MYDQIVDVLTNLYGERDAAFESYRAALKKKERKTIVDSLNDYHAKKKQIDRISGVFVDESQKALQEYNHVRSVFRKQIQ
jgi:cAMP phosphodiesterase